MEAGIYVRRAGQRAQRDLQRRRRRRRRQVGGSIRKIRKANDNEEQYEKKKKEEEGPFRIQKRQVMGEDGLWRKEAGSGQEDPQVCSSSDASALFVCASFVFMGK